MCRCCARCRRPAASRSGWRRCSRTPAGAWPDRQCAPGRRQSTRSRRRSRSGRCSGCGSCPATVRRHSSGQQTGPPSRRPIAPEPRRCCSPTAAAAPAGALLLAAVWLFLLRYVPDRALLVNPTPTPGVFPIRSNLLHVFAPRAAAVLAFLLVFGLLGGWLLAGRMLAPLAHITDATRMAANGSLSHRIQLQGRRDEFRELADAFDTMLARLEAHIAEQQRFAANASHELRTPLAITQTLLDVARNDPNRDTGELVA